MTKTLLLLKKFRSIFIVTGMLTMFSLNTSAQTVYHDQVPDATVDVTPGSTDTLDLDNNGVDDFIFSVQHYTSSGVTYDVALVIPADPNNAVDTSTSTVPGFETSVKHNLNDPINNTCKWLYGAATSYQLLAGKTSGAATVSGGNFLGQTDKYVAVRFKIGSQWHYGWIRISVNATATLITVQDWAYDATTDASILAGVYVGIEENNLADNVSINPADHVILVNFTSAIPVKGKVTVNNVLGQELSTTEITGSNIAIPMEGATTGIYFVTVSAEGKTYTKKIIIK